MKKTHLLNEQTIRKWMKLANMKETLTENFINKLNEKEDEKEDEENTSLPPEIENPEELEEPKELENPETPAMETNEDEIVQLVNAIADAIQDVTGVDVSVEKGMGKEPEKEELPVEPKLDNSLEKNKEEEEVMKEDTIPSGDRTEYDEDQRELPTHDQVVEEKNEKLEEEEKIEENKEFGGTKDMKMKNATMSKKNIVKENKIKISKEKLVEEVSKRIIEKLAKTKK